MPRYTADNELLDSPTTRRPLIDPLQQSFARPVINHQQSWWLEEGPYEGQSLEAVTSAFLCHAVAFDQLAFVSEVFDGLRYFHRVSSFFVSFCVAVDRKGLLEIPPH